MEFSYRKEAAFTCSHCRKAFPVLAWLIVDTQGRADLHEAICTGTLHDYTCPHCGQPDHYGDTPLLLYRPGKTPTLLFSPAQNTTSEEDDMQATILVMMLRERLGRAWHDSWWDELTLVGRDLLPS